MSLTRVVRDIPYGKEKDNTHHKFDLHFVPSDAQQGSDEVRPGGLIVFVHGGAWRSEDKSQHATLASRLALSTGYPVAVPNYRLTASKPQESSQGFHAADLDVGNEILQHPSHAADILTFLNFAVSSQNNPLPQIGNHIPASYDPTRLFLIGHSCSAHMLCSIVLDSSPLTPTLTPSSSLQSMIKSMICSEGIYSLSALVSRSPTYQSWFVEPAFGPDFTRFDVDVLRKRNQDRNSPRWLFIHSLDDDLVNVEQSQSMYSHLLSLTHQDPASGVNSDDIISKDFTLRGSHNGLLETSNYVDLVSGFITTAKRG